MDLNVFMWIVGILLGFIGALLGIMWTMLNRALDKLDATLAKIDHKLDEEIRDRAAMEVRIRDRVRDEQINCLADCTGELEKRDDKLDGIREDIEDCKDTMSGFEAGLVQRSELKDILAEFVAAVNVGRDKNG